MSEIILPARAPMAGPPDLRWTQADKAGRISLLRRVVDGLRSLDRPGCRQNAAGPIRSYAHAYQVMDVHAGHNCDRFAAAVLYAHGERP